MKDSQSPKPTAAWYLVPIFLGLLGGLIMWLVLKENKNPSTPKMIQNGWVIGIVIMVIGFIASSPLVFL